MLILEGVRIILRDHIISDLEDMHEWISDNKIMRFLPGMKTSSIDETKNRLIESIEESLKSNRKKYFFAVLLKTGEIIGDAGFTVLCKNEDGGIANIGYFLKKQFWGNGYGTEAASLMIQYCFEKIKLHKVTAGCDAENRSSEQVMIKCGMKKEAEYKRHVLINGEWRDRLEYAIIKN